MTESISPNCNFQTSLEGNLIDEDPVEVLVELLLEVVGIVVGVDLD